MTVQQAPGGSPSVANVMRPIADAAGWMKLIGTLAIIYGVVMCLTIVGLLFGWLPIWMGVLLRRSADDAQRAVGTGDEATAIASAQGLHTLFKVQGVLALIGLVFMATALVLSVLLVAAGRSS